MRLFQKVFQALKRRSLADEGDSHLTLEATLHSIGEGVVAFDMKGEVVFINEAEARICGYASASEMQRNLKQFAQDFEIMNLDGSPLPMSEWPVSRVLRGESLPGLELKGRRRDTKQEWCFNFSGRPVFDSKGKQILAVLVTRDITKAKESEQALKASEAQYRQIADRLKLTLLSAKVGSWEWDIATGNVNISGIFAEVFDLDRRTESIDINRVYDRVLPEDRELVGALLQEAIEKKEDYVSEFRIRRQDGSLRWISGRGHANYDASGKAAKMFGVNIDVTDRKQIEEQLKEAVKKANAASDLKSAFLANMSHEIRTPLGAILGFTELLRDNVTDADERANYFEIIRRNGDQLSTLINDILDLSKVEAGELKVETHPTHLGDLVKDVVASLSVRANEKQLTLDSSVCQQLPVHLGTDPTRLKQILTNVVGNSIKFTSKGSVALAVSSNDDLVRFTVKDTGIGISPSSLPQLFRPFSQADDSTTRQFGGTGLGLALSKKLAQALGGDLVIRSSEPGVGSVFELTIENRDYKKEKPEARLSEIPVANLSSDLDSQEQTRLEGMQILLVDDSSDNRQFISRMLSKRGAIVATAENGEIAVAKAMSDNYDLVLMDLQMPVMDGYVATKKLRERGFKKPVIALTAHAMSEIRTKCLEVGCNDQITKPVNPAELYGVLWRYSGLPL